MAWFQPLNKKMPWQQDTSTKTKPQPLTFPAKTEDADKKQPDKTSLQVTYINSKNLLLLIMIVMMMIIIFLKILIFKILWIFYICMQNDDFLLFERLQGIFFFRFIQSMLSVKSWIPFADPKCHVILHECSCRRKYHVGILLSKCDLETDIWLNYVCIIVLSSSE